MPASTTTPAPEIETATVEIRTITIDSRRMSAGYLRQLIEQPIITPDGTLAGEPWGYVNVHPDRCDDSENRHVHLVWQLGAELRRARVNAPECASFAPPVASAYAMARVLEGARSYDADRNFRIYRSSTDRFATTVLARIRHDDVVFDARIPAPFMRLWDVDAGDKVALNQMAEAEIDGVLPFAGDVAVDLTKAADTYRAAWSALEGLPQLFIGG
jgi:hypothetical protein